MPTYRGKLKKFLDVEMPKELKAIVKDCVLLSPVDCLLTVLDGQLMTTFVER